MELKKIQTEKLILELASRDLFKEIRDEEKVKWLRKVGARKIGKFSFVVPSSNHFFSLEYLNNTELEAIKKYYRALYP